MKKLFTNSLFVTGWRKVVAVQFCFITAGLMLLACISFPQFARAQSGGVFLESNGLVVMETESVDRPFNWNFENSLDGFTGDGYLRYIGANHFSEPGIDVLEFDILIVHPGEYKMFLWASHIDAPEPDQNNDAWTKMDDGDWIKTVHPGPQQEQGFSFHTQWVKNINGQEVFEAPTYQLDAGVHTFYISGRSWSFRIDRIHIWKNDDPFKVSYDNATLNTHPESERDNTIITVTPSPITFSPTAIGLVSEMAVTLSNDGDDPVNISNVSISGNNGSEFGTDFSGSLSVPAHGSNELNVTFTPTSHGTKLATMTITHDGFNSPTNVSLFGTAGSGGSGSTVLFRVNAGGPAIGDPDGDWQEDQSATPGHNNGNATLGTPHPYVNSAATGDWTFGRDEAVTVDFSVPAGTPVELFQRGRWDPGNVPTLQWDIPIEAGTEMEVRLYFSEQLFTAPDVPPDVGWPRIFDVEIDGVIYGAFDDLNIFEEVGHGVGMMRSVVIISDGNVDIDFLNISHDPIIQGIEILEVGSISRAMDQGWNLVGVPATPLDDNYASVFDEVGVIVQPYTWNGSSYAQVMTVQPGVGYWLKLASGGSQSFNDDAVDVLELDLEAGWNMISGPACVIAWDDISDPGNILIDESLYSYSGGYLLSAALLPGAGYWVQASNTGTVTMDCNAAGKTGGLSLNSSVELDQFGLLEISDAQGRSQQLYFGGKLDESVDIRRFAMPPRGQVGDFDVRFNDDSRLSQAEEHTVRIESEAYPVRITLERRPMATIETLTVEELVNGQVVDTHELRTDEEITIYSERVDALRIKTAAKLSDAVPETFVLQGNYPNPFNPSTQLVFDMPEAGTVRVEVFDLLGRSVMRLPAQDVTAGAGRQISIDASSLPSGTYLYHLGVEMASETVTKVGRMTLIK